MNRQPNRQRSGRLDWMCAVALGVACVLACSETSEPRGPRPRVVVSVAPQAYLVGRLAGDRVEVETMIPPGANPVSYEPTIRQRRALAEADLYVKLGHPQFPLEAMVLGDLLAENRKVRIVDCSKGVALIAGDPHFWLSPRHLRAIARNTAAGLAAVLPEQRNGIDSQLTRLLAELDELDAEIREMLAVVRGRSFFVFHPAWGYFAQEYGLVQVAIEKDHKTPDSRGLAQLIHEAKLRDVNVIFVQPQFDPRSAELVAHEIHARIEVLDPLAYEVLENLRTAARRIAAATVQ